jgi:hypothetical protein
MDEIPSEDEVRTFVGRKVEYYVQRWPSDPEDETGLMGFNWAAFFLSVMWLGYRKMYGIAAILVTLVVVESVVEEVYLVGRLGMPEPPESLNGLISGLIATVCGTFGNRWYFTHAKKVISDVRFEERGPEARKTALTKRGGTSWFGALLVMVLAFVAMYLAFLPLDLSQV